jgi:hypothetical protein
MIWTAPPPSRVILLPPSMTTWTAVPPVDIGGLSVDVTEMVTGLAPQLNVMIPPPFTAVERAWKVQLDGVPVPTTVVGWLVSTGCASAGRVSVVQEPLGFPATGNVPDPASLDVPLEPPESLEPLPELPPLLVELELAPLLLLLALDPAPLDPPLEPASLDVPLDPPESLEPLPELPLLVDPELAPLLPLPLDPAPLDPVPLDPVPFDDPLEVLAPSEDSPPSSPAPGPLPELDPCDEPPSFWPEALFACEPVLSPHPTPSAKERENKSKTRSARIVVLPSKCLV